MKKNDVKQLKNMSPAELDKKIREAGEKLGKLEDQIGSGKHKNVHEAHALRKDIARMLTEIRARMNNEQ